MITELNRQYITIHGKYRLDTLAWLKQTGLRHAYNIDSDLRLHLIQKAQNKKSEKSLTEKLW